MAKEDVMVVDEFKKVILSHLKDVLIAIPAIIPQSDEDTILFRKGMAEINELIYNLEHCSNIRELSRYINVQKVVEDFDMDSIKTLDLRITNTARSSIEKLESMISERIDD